MCVCTQKSEDIFMVDAKLREIIDPTLDRIADFCVSVGLSANKLTVIGFACGCMCALFIIWEQFIWAIFWLSCNRVCDGLDGAVARKKEVTDFGGYLDIVCDFLFYGLVPLSFSIALPHHGVAGCFLLFSFIGTGSSFLAYAILQAKHPEKQLHSGQKKSFFYIGGLTEGTETIALFVVMCLFPHLFSFLAYGFGILCWITTGQRIAIAYIDFAQK